MTYTSQYINYLLEETSNGVRVGNQISEQGKSELSEETAKCSELDTQNKKLCEIRALNLVIGNLRSRTNQCNNTDNPTECQNRILKRINVYNNKIKRIKKSLGR